MMKPAPTQPMPTDRSFGIFGRWSRSKSICIVFLIVRSVGRVAQADEAPLLAVLDHVPDLRLDELLEFRQQSRGAAARAARRFLFTPVDPPAPFHPNRHAVEQDQTDQDHRDDGRYLSHFTAVRRGSRP